MQVYVNDKYNVIIKRIEISGTYSGVMEGTRETASEFIREEMRDHANFELEKSKRLIWILDSDPKKPLPEYTCKANLFSSWAPDYKADYTVAEIWWFVPEIDLTPQQLVENIFVENDWYDFCQPWEF